MSLKETYHVTYWNTIPKCCKNCRKAIYTIEDGKVYYQCSACGKFKKDCNLQTSFRLLPSPDAILKGNK